MNIKSLATKEKTYDCYDFTCVGPVTIPLTLDLESGDTIEVGPDKIIVTVQERPSLSDPKKLLPAENVVIERGNLLFYQHRLMKTLEQTAEQHEEWKETILQATKSVN
jgi:hypothetical protein